jgi:hypothetical protein
MLNLYRGILDILSTNSTQLGEQLTRHVRQFNDGVEENGFGAKGFWNLLLELSLNFYIKFITTLGMMIAVMFVIIFFPLNLFKNAIAQLLRGSTTSIFMDQKIDPTLATTTTEPVTSKKTKV